MNRRTYLASLAALTTGSGCVSSAVTQNSPNQMERTVSVSNVARRPPAEPEKLDEDEKPTDLAFDVAVSDAEITPRSTARVTLRYTNRGEDTLELNINPDRPDPQPSTGEDPGLILLSDAYEPTRSTANCWKPEQDRFPQPAVAYQHPIEPAETETLEYDVWAAPRQEADCIRPEDYKLEPLYGSFTLTVTTNESGS